MCFVVLAVSVASVASPGAFELCSDSFDKQIMMLYQQLRYCLSKCYSVAKARVEGRCVACHCERIDTIWRCISTPFVEALVCFTTVSNR